MSAFQRFGIVGFHCDQMESVCVCVCPWSHTVCTYIQQHVSKYSYMYASKMAHVQ